MSLGSALVASLAQLLSPLPDALRDPNRLAALLTELDRPVDVPEADLERIASLLPVLEPTEALFDLALEYADGTLEAGDLISRGLPLAQSVLDGIQALSDLSPADVQGLAAPLDDPATWEGVAADLPEYLFVQWLQLWHPLVFALLELGGVVTRSEPEGEEPVRFAFSWDALGQLVGDPAGQVAQTYDWGGRLDHEHLIPRLGAVARAAGIGARAVSAGDVLQLEIPLWAGPTADGAAYVILGLRAAPVRASGTGEPDAILLTSEVAGGVAGTLDLGGGWSLTLSGAADASGALGVVVGPEGTALAGPDAVLGAAITLATTGGEAWHLLGDGGGTRLDVESASLEVRADATGDAGLTVEVGSADGILVVIDPGEGDGFLAEVLGAFDLSVRAGLTLTWSSSSGVRLGGQSGFDVTLPLDLAVGPLRVATVRLALIGGSDGATIEAAATGGLVIGPFSAVVEDIGLRVALTPAPGGGGFGSTDLTLGFKPPTGVGFAFDLGEAGHGGGFVGYDPALGRYTGALELDLVSVGLGAVLVIDTRLPGDPSGWALFASVFATFPSMPLGFGFFLSGVGGLVCLNRTLDEDALASGLETGAIDAILFMDDPLEEVPLILSQLDAWFPLAPGSTVFGIAAKITWGTPVSIIAGELGVALVLPDLEIAVMGSVSMALPTEEEALLELHMDSLGVIDVPGRTAMVVASLYDSALLSTIHLSGDMAFYVSVGTTPYFLMSVGGYHPDFDPPCGLPPSVLDLNRMRAEIAISEDVYFALEAYVAVTANTLQFGSLATLEASAKFLLTTYVARGSVGFDVLLVFSPFSFSASFAVSVTVTAGDKELMAVELSARLDGPAPWYTCGTARFEFFGVGVRFDFEFGGHAPTETPARQEVCELVRTALDDPTAWRAAQPAWVDASVLVFAADDAADAAAVWVRPDAELEARQTVAPLDRPLDHFGEYGIDGPATIAVTGSGIDGATDAGDAVTILDWFAPAQYDDLARAEKLAAPSYEEMATGVRFSAGGIGFDGADATSVVPNYEERILDEDGTTRPGDARAAAISSAATAAIALDTALRRTPRTVTSATFTVGAPTWQTFDPATASATGPATSYRAAQLALAAAVAADPGGGLCLAPTHAAQAVA